MRATPHTDYSGPPWGHFPKLIVRGSSHRDALGSQQDFVQHAWSRVQRRSCLDFFVGSSPFSSSFSAPSSFSLFSSPSSFVFSSDVSLLHEAYISMYIYGCISIPNNVKSSPRLQCAFNFGGHCYHTKRLLWLHTISSVPAVGHQLLWIKRMAMN